MSEITNRPCPCSGAAANPLLDAALSYAARGWRVFPCHSIRGGRCSCSNSINVRCAAVPPSPGKHPRTAHGCKDATTDAQQIRDWWTSWPDAHVAIATGAESGLVVLDVDPRHGGDDSLAELETKHGKADTVEALTGSGGRHLFFAHPGYKIGNTAGRVAAGLDTRGDGGYVIAAPSGHISGGSYSWESSSEPDMLPLAPWPEWLRERTAQAASLPAAPDKMIPAGARRQHLMDLAVRMRKAGATEPAIVAGLVAEFETHCEPEPPRTPGDLEGIAAWTFGHVSLAPEEPPPPTDADAPADSLDPPDAAAPFPVLNDLVAVPERMMGEDGPSPGEIKAQKELARCAPSVDDALEPAFALFRRRFTGEEKPMPTPWPGVSLALGGGFWPGAHIITGATAAGKTAAALQEVLCALAVGHPVLYIGLELDRAQIVARLASIILGASTFDGSVVAPWSRIYTGKVDPDRLEPARAQLAGLPLHIEEAPPGGWSSKAMRGRVDAIRAAYPTTLAPLVVLDFLQLVGPTDSNPRARHEELRERIGVASYAGREVARRCDAVVLMLSSISRAGALEIGTQAKKGKLGTGDPSDFVGLGKESGDIEFSADSVICLAREPKKKGDRTTSIWAAIAKLRAGVPSWHLLSFNGSWLDEVDQATRDQHTNNAEAQVAAKTAAEEQSQIKATSEEIVSLLEDGPRSGTAIEEHVTGRGEHIRRVLGLLAEERVISKTAPGYRGHKNWELCRPDQAELIPSNPVRNPVPAEVGGGCGAIPSAPEGKTPVGGFPTGRDSAPSESHGRPQNGQQAATEPGRDRKPAKKNGVSHPAPDTHDPSTAEGRAAILAQIAADRAAPAASAAPPPAVVAGLNADEGVAPAEPEPSARQRVLDAPGSDSEESDEGD